MLVEKYQNYLQKDPGFKSLEDSINMHNDILSQEDVDNWTGVLNDLILTNATKSFPKRKKRQTKDIKRTKGAAWYTKECSKAHTKLKQAMSKMKHPIDRNMTEQMIAARKIYRSTCRKAEATHRKKTLTDLLSTPSGEPKKFWNKLKNMKSWGTETSDPSSQISTQNWIQHFSKLLNTDKPASFSIRDCHKTKIPEMDAKITVQEVKDMLRITKAGKAYGPDGICMEFLKYAPDNVTATLTSLINAIYGNALYPTQWTINYLRALYKKGDKDDTGNYRGLAIGSALGKLYSMILLKRLETFTSTHKIICPTQIGFRRGFRTADHVFVLKTAVTKAIKNNMKLYAAFIDFQKAYDTVNRSILLKRLEAIGISHKMLLNINALYNRTEYAIKLTSHICKPIPSNLGLKQGCPLSPLLFNIYINDLVKYLDNETDTLKLQGSPISHFLYADDLVLLSTSKDGLQKNLDRLNTFAEDKDLTINTSKSKVMIFNKTGRTIKKHLMVNQVPLEVVQSFTYLGVDIKASGSFTSAIQNLNSKAKKAMVQLYRMITQFQMPFSQSIKLFRAFIEPIILYNSENLSTLTQTQIHNCKLNHKNLYELALKARPTITQLNFGKFILVVIKICPTMAVLGEAACLPLTWNGYLSILKFWDRIRRMDNTTLVNKAYHDNLEMNTEWCQTIQILNASQGLNSKTYTALRFPSEAKKTMTYNFIDYWKTRIADRSTEKKLALYSSIKPTFCRSQYLELLPYKLRKVITRFISSNHNLNIEKGRHIGLERPKIICKLCDLGDLGVVEDEQHFLCVCPTYNDLRHKYLPPCSPHSTLLKDILESTDPLNLGKFLKSAFARRRELTELKYHVANVSLTGLSLTLRTGDNKTNHYFIKSRSKTSLNITLRRQTKPYARTLPKLIKTNLSKDGLKFKISKK